MYEQEYRGYKVFFEEKTDKWQACLMDTSEGIAKGSYDGHSPDFEDASRKALFEKIDAYSKKEFKRIKVLGFGYEGSSLERIREGEITSITEDGKVWVSWKREDGDGVRREKEYTMPFLDAPDNRELMAQHIEKSKAISILQNEKAKLYGKLVHVAKVL